MRPCVIMGKNSIFSYWQAQGAFRSKLFGHNAFAWCINVYLMFECIFKNCKWIILLRYCHTLNITFVPRSFSVSVVEIYLCRSTAFWFEHYSLLVFPKFILNGLVWLVVRVMHSSLQLFPKNRNYFWINSLFLWLIYCGNFGL